MYGWETLEGTSGAHSRLNPNEGAFMRARVSIVGAILIATMLATIGVVSAQGDTPGIDQLVQSFRDATISGDLVVANDPDALSPFGGPSQLPPDKIDQITVEEYTAFRLNPLGDAGFDPDGIQIATARRTDDGTIETEIIHLPLAQIFIPPFRPGGAPTVESFFTVFFEVPLPDEFGDLFGEGTPFPVVDALVIPPATGGPLDLEGPVVIRGLRVRGMLPMQGCGGDILELFTGDAIGGAPLWEPQDFAPNDSFGGISQAHVTRCSDGMWQPTELLVNQGPNFQLMPTDTIAVLFPEGIFWVIPANEVSGSMGMRVGAFLTPQNGGYQEDNVGFTTGPPYPDLTLPGSDPFFIEHPFPGHTLHPVALEMGDADSGAPGFSGNYGIAVDAEDDSGDIDTFDAHMIQFDTYQISLGKIKYAAADGTYSGEMIGSGDGYTESYSFTDGTYVYDPGSPATYPMTVGSDDGLVQQLQTVYDERDLAAQAAETTTAKAPDTGSDGEDTVTEPEDTAAESTPISVDDGGTNPILFILAILLLLAAAGFLWWWFFLRPKPDPCHEEWLAWQKAQKDCDDAQKTAKEKRKAADDATKARKKADKDLKDHCKAFPPACGPQSSATDVASGRTVTRDDLHVQKQWAADAWSRYKAGTQSAQETEDQWNTPPPEDFRKKQMEKLEDAKAKTPGLEKAASDAKDAEEAANDAADEAERAAKDACDKAAAAKKAYDDCIGAGAAVAGAEVGEGAGAAGAAVGGIGGAVAGGAAAAGRAAGKSCEKERLAYEAAKKACDEASKAAADADAEARAADKAAEGAEDALDKLCDDFPPVCRDDWIQEAGRPETRITTTDLHVGEAWADKVWQDYKAGTISADEASQRWGQDPPADFRRDELAKIKNAGAKQPGLEKAAKDAKAKADAKRAAADKARTAADDACAKATAARKAWEACQSR